jgi:hypothetical protein
MPATDVAAPTGAIRQYWPATPGEKARRCVGKVFEQVRMGKYLRAKIESQDGVYTVVIAAIQKRWRPYHRRSHRSRKTSGIRSWRRPRSLLSR